MISGSRSVRSGRRRRVGSLDRSEQSVTGVAGGLGVRCERLQLRAGADRSPSPPDVEGAMHGALVDLLDLMGLWTDEMVDWVLA